MNAIPCTKAAHYCQTQQDQHKQWWPAAQLDHRYPATRQRHVSIRCCASNGSSSVSTLRAPRSPFQTGGTSPGYSSGNKRVCLRDEPLKEEKFVVVVRHGLTTWNESKRIQVLPSLAWLVWSACDSSQTSLMTSLSQTSCVPLLVKPAKRT